MIARYVALVGAQARRARPHGLSQRAPGEHAEVHKRNPMDLFRAAVQTWPEVVECAALTGEMDFLLRVVVEDMAHYCAS